MLLLYPREILILDLELSQTVGVVAIERSGVPFIQVRQCVHELQIRCGKGLKKTSLFEGIANLKRVDLIYEISWLIYQLHKLLKGQYSFSSMPCF